MSRQRCDVIREFGNRCHAGLLYLKFGLAILGRKWDAESYIALLSEIDVGNLSSVEPPDEVLSAPCVKLILFSEMPAREGWVCDFESGQVCLNFRMSGWVYFSPVKHSADTQYEPEVDHTSGRDSGQLLCIYRVFTLSDTENENDNDNKNDNYGFHYNMQSTSHCTETDSNTDFH